jgi:hypothetical protein
MRTPTLALLLMSSVCSAQLGHDMPPPVNVIGAGFNLEHSAKVREAAAWTFLAGSLATAALSQANGTRDSAAPWIAGTLTFGLAFSLNLHGLRWENRAADLWQCGYAPDYLYEAIPDSVGMEPPRQYKVPRMIDGKKIHLPGKFR